MYSMYAQSLHEGGTRCELHAMCLKRSGGAGCMSYGIHGCCIMLLSCSRITVHQNGRLCLLIGFALADQCCSRCPQQQGSALTRTLPKTDMFHVRQAVVRL
jgi:hypothetical protein